MTQNYADITTATIMVTSSKALSNRGFNFISIITKVSKFSVQTLRAFLHNMPCLIFHVWKIQRFFFGPGRHIIKIHKIDIEKDKPRSWKYTVLESLGGFHMSSEYYMFVKLITTGDLHVQYWNINQPCCVGKNLKSNRVLLQFSSFYSVVRGLY